MTQLALAWDYLNKAKKRLKVLDLLFNEKDYSDVVREAQEVVELALKGMLRSVGIDPPKWHDVGPILMEHKELFGRKTGRELGELSLISKKLRKEREFSFYGADDFIPSEEYSKKDAEEAIKAANKVVRVAASTIEKK